MTVCYVFHSETGTTREIIDKCAALIKGEKIEIRDLMHYNRFTKYLIGGKRAMKVEKDPIEPAVIDVSAFDVIVIGSPVWAGKPSPAINSAMKALKGCEGKKAIIVATCGGNAGETTEVMRKVLEERQMTVAGIIVFTKKDLNDQERINSLVTMIQRATGTLI